VRDLAPTDTRELRRFALGLGAFVCVLFGLVLPWLRAGPQRAWPWFAGGALVLLGLAWPRGAWPLYRAWRPAARLLGLVNTWLLLGLVYVCVLIPLGWLLRLGGRLQYRTGFDPRATSYRVPVPPGHTTDLEEPF
jgi:hypothetical protein